MCNNKLIDSIVYGVVLCHMAQCVTGSCIHINR